MPVRKYRSVADMPDSQPLSPLDPDNLRIACELSEMLFALRPWRLEAGVRKFRSSEEAALYRMQLDRRPLPRRDREDR